MAVTTADKVGRIFAAAGKTMDKQLAIALTRTAKDARDAVKEEIGIVFHKPVPFVQNGVFYKGASTSTGTYIGGKGYKNNPDGVIMRNQLNATIWFKDDWVSGMSVDEIMQPQVFGGGRKLKGMEKSLQRIGVLPVGMYIVPGRDAKLDSYGNISRGQITQILAFFSAFRELGHKANMTDKTRARLARDRKQRKTGKIIKGFEYFAIIQPGEALPQGIYQRLRYGERTINRCVMLFVTTPVYQKRLRFFETVEKTVRDKLDGHFADAGEFARKVVRAA